MIVKPELIKLYKLSAKIKNNKTNALLKLYY